VFSHQIRGGTVFKSIGQVAAYKPLYGCNIEELAAMLQHTQPSGGMLFARNPDREAKDAARQKILDLFTPAEKPGHLRILTMPGLDWRFERKLLGSREGDWMRKAGPGRTGITAVENDRYIYYSAVTTMPGLNTRRALTRFLPPESFAERTTRTKFLNEFHFANVDDLMRETTKRWDAVWLDYTGPLTVERLRLIARFYNESVRDTLIVTALKARYNRETSDAIDRAGGHSEWLRKYLPGEILHDIEYFDTSPMAQFAVRREGAAS
jgi:hypothetical protein